MIHDHKLLLTPGPITTSNSVKEAMLNDLGTRDSDYNEIVQSIRMDLLNLAQANDQYTVILLQGSGTYGVESVLTSTVLPQDKILILENGAYGKRMQEICEKANIPYGIESFSMIETLPIHKLENLISDKQYTHVAFIHCETTAGVMNDLEAIMMLIKKYNKIAIVDAMSSFGSLPISLTDLGIDYLITSSNKCLHGVPGISIIFALKKQLELCQGICKSLSLDLYEQYQFMEQHDGGFRFTSPTHVLLALQVAIQELLAIGGISTRHAQYVKLQQKIQNFMVANGFQTLVKKEQQSPIITTYLIPEFFDFADFYNYMKNHGFLLYSGKLPNYNAFRIGNIGNISEADIDRLLCIITSYQKEN